MANFEELKALVAEKGTEATKETVKSAEKYMEGFKKVFAERDVSNAALEIDLSMAARELADEGAFEGKEGMEITLYMMNVMYIARHTWEFVDDYGRKKTGDNLHKAWPLIFEGNEMLNTEDLFRDLELMIR